MEAGLQRSLEKAGIDPDTFVQAVDWATTEADKQKEVFDHTNCDGMVTDFDSCEHTDPVQGPRIEEEHSRFEAMSTAFHGLKGLIDAPEGIIRRGSDSLSGHVVL